MTPSLNLNLCRLFLPNHGLLVVKVLIFLSTANFCAAQPRTSASSAPPFIDPLPPPAKFNPSVALLMVIIVSTFFCLGFFSIYVRRCTGGGYTRGNFDPTGPPIGGGDRFSRRGQHGLDSAVVETFPTFLYSTVKGHKIGKGSLECAVCLNEFEDDQTLRLIPKCSHVFHTDCIDVWLVSHPTCPVCRANLLPKPGDLPFDSVNIFELENNSIESDQQPFNIRNETQNDFRIRISDDDDRNRPILQTPNRPPRSWSTGWRLGSFFPKSRSTGHLLVQPREDMERFTLRLPEEIRNQLLNTHLNRAKSCVAFPRATSSRRGYRSRSGGSWRGKNYFYYERFDQNLQPDRMGCSKAPPFMLRTGSVQSSKGIGGSDEMNATPPKSLLKSIKSPFDRLFIGTDNNSNINNVGEGSSDRLRHDDVRHNQV